MAQAESDESMLLERVFLRLGSADTDEKFEALVGKFLTAILLKLASPSEGIRKKVMELLVHVNKRLKSRPEIQLPIKDLLQQYMDDNISSFVRNFSIIYIKMGFVRVDSSEQASLVPQLLLCIDGKPAQHQTIFLQLLMPALVHLNFTRGSPDQLTQYKLEGHPEIHRRLLDHMLDYLLLPYNFGVYQERARSESVATQPSTSTPTVAAGETAEPAFSGPPPGMSRSAFKAVLGDTPPSPDQLEKVKHAIVEYLGADIYQTQDILVHLLVATADTRYIVTSAATQHLKRLAGAEDWNNSSTVTKLYNVFQGTVAIKGKPLQMKSDDKRVPASVQLRLKILPYLLKSREAASQFPACVQMIFDCLYGNNTNAKLKALAVQFVHHLCLHCTEAKFRPMGAVLLSGMVKLIGEAKQDAKLRMLSYVAIGKIARRMPQLVNKDLALLQNLFDSITQESSENMLAVQEALSMMADAFTNIDANSAKLIEALVMQNIDKPEASARQMAVEYVRTVFPRDHVASSYVLLLACGDVKDEIRAEAARILLSEVTGDRKTDTRTKTDSEDGHKGLPPFTDMVNYIHEQGSLRVKTQHKITYGNNVFPFKPATYAQMVLYLRTCLAYSAGVKSPAQSVNDMRSEAPTISKYIESTLSGVDRTALTTYITLTKQLLSVAPGAVPMYCILELVAMAPKDLVTSFCGDLEWIRTFMFSHNEEVRTLAAELYAVVHSANKDETQLTQTINDLVKIVAEKTLEEQHGALMCLGFLIGQVLANEKAEKAGCALTDMETDQGADLQKAVLAAVTTVVGVLDSSQLLLSLGASTSLGEMGRRGVLPLPADASDSSDTAACSKIQVVEKLITKLQASKEHEKIREQAGITLGYFCVGESNFPHREKILNGLLDSAGAQQFDLHVTLGDALVCVALGGKSPEARNKWTESSTTFTGEKDGKDVVNNLLKLLLEKYSRSKNPHIRQAACIWLVSLTKQCADHGDVQKSLLHIQRTFIHLLGEENELTQDMASKGLGIVYEICGEDQKKELVSMLMDTLMSGTRKRQEVTADTQVFESGALGKTPDGQNLTTYKELCSIANDLNQPDLIYKFMHLANHNATWNTKKGAALGFKTIAAQAGEQLEPHLHKIVPKLFRYQFDPNPKIQGAMSSIWSALVPKTKETVDRYLPEILADVQTNLISNQWRNRQSSCMAVADLLRGRALDEVVDALPVLWENLFRVRDDIKESVRNAAEIALSAISKASIKVCDANAGKVGEKATALVLPCLLKCGITSTVKEVREISLSTVMKMSKSAGALLKPHIPLLCVALLESLSTLEAGFLNYASLHLASNTSSLEKLDSARIAASKSSPMMDTINLCVQHTDDDVLKELLPRITDLIRSSVGLATKAGCANLLISLSHQYPQGVAPYAGKLLGTLLNGLGDKNTTVKKCYATAMGHIVKVAKDSSVEKLVSRIKEWYLTKEDEALQTACARVIQSMNQHAPDVVRRHATLVLPLAFFAMHCQEPDQQSESSTEESKKSLWSDIWLEMTPGTEAGVQLYLTEIVELSRGALQSQSWARKAQAAVTMAAIADSLQANLSSQHVGLLLGALLDGLAGRTWTGKNSLLKAIGVVCTSCKDAVKEPRQDGPLLDRTLSALFKECHKEQLSYKFDALTYTTDVLHAHDLDRFKDISEIIFPLLKKKEHKDADDDINHDEWLKFREIGYTCLNKSWPTAEHRATQGDFREQFLSVILDGLDNTVWKVELASLKCLHTYINRLYIFKSVDTLQTEQVFVEKFLQQTVPVISRCLGKVKYSSIRSAALDIAETLFNHPDIGKIMLGMVTESYLSVIQSAVDQLASNDTQPEIQDRATQLRTILGN